MIVKRKKSETIEERLDGIVEQLNELKAEVAEFRKQSSDELPEVVSLLLDIKPHVGLARATYEKKDIEKAERLLQEAKTMFNEFKEGSPFSHVLRLIEEGNEHFRHGDKYGAWKVYNNIQAYYGKVDPELRRYVYPACVALHEKLEN